jgi:hypothetical protein
MKSIHPLFTTALALALGVFSTAARAETFQIVDDAAGSTKTNTIAKAAGLATTLPVSSKSTAFLRFNVSGSGVVSSAVTEARLVIYLPKITKPGTLTLNVNDTGFTEIFATRTIPSPTLSSTVTTIPVVAADTKSFITIVVTDQVKAWLDGTLPENGFSITSDGTASVLISSKEGSGSGYPAVLEVDAAGTGGAVAGSDATFTGSLSAGSGSFSGALTGTTGAFTGALSGGSLGIGTTTPSFPIDVQGTGGLAVNLNQTGGGAAGVLQTNPNRSFFTGILDGNNRWSIYDATGGNYQERLTVAANGNVGIGTSTPGFKLDVATNSAVEIALRSTSVNGRVYTLQNSDGAANLGDGSFQIIDRTAVVARMIIDKTGNVGFGIVPGTKIDLVGTIRTKGDVKLGSTGQLFAVSGEENLRTVRGIVSVGAGATVFAGSGFTVARTAGAPIGAFTVTFSTAFTGLPSVTANAYSDLSGSVARTVAFQDIQANTVSVRVFNDAGGLEDQSFSFIAIGPR